MKAIYVGVDPGAHGGIAALDPLGLILCLYKMPETETDLLTILHGLGNTAGPCFVRAVLERAQASPQMGTVSAFTYGVGYGGLRMALLASHIPFDTVTSRVWQKAIGVPSAGGAIGKKDKNLSKARAQALFPQQKITHANADALLLAEYCRRTHALERDPFADFLPADIK